MRGRPTSLEQEIKVRSSEGVLPLKCTLEVLTSHSIVLFGVAHPVLDLKDLDREDGDLASPKSLYRGSEELTYDHTPLCRYVGTIVNRAEDDLITTT